MHSLTEPIGSTTVTARRDPKEKDKINTKQENVKDNKENIQLLYDYLFIELMKFQFYVRMKMNSFYFYIDFVIILEY